MAQGNTQPVTTFLLLKSHEPSCPPSITDAGSQAGQAFNQVLRYIASCPGFQFQLFGWPAEPQSEDINVNEWMASIMPGQLGMFINWDDERSAKNFLSPTSMTQAFQGLTAFFEIPHVMDVGAIWSLDEPVVFNIAWYSGDVTRMLNRTKLPLQISISDGTNDLGPLSAPREEDEDEHAAGVALAEGDQASVTVVKLSHFAPQVSVHTLSSSHKNLVLSLMRTRYCSRIKEDLYDMICARRVD